MNLNYPVSNVVRMSLATRLRGEREALGMSQADLAARAKVSQQLVAKIESGGVEESRKIRQLARALDGLSPDWLAEGKGAKRVAPADLDTDDWADVNAYAQAVSLGDGAAAVEYAETHKLKFRAKSLRRMGLNPARLKVYYGDGDSMEPRIRDGDAIMFNTDETEPVDDGIFVIRYDGEYYAKRLQQIGDRWFLVSDNTHDPKWRKPRPIDSKKDFHVEGRVRWVGSWER